MSEFLYLNIEPLDPQSLEYKFSQCFFGEAEGDSGMGAGAQSDAQAAENESQGAAEVGDGGDSRTTTGGPDIAGLAAAEAALGVGLDAYGNAQTDHYSRAFDNLTNGDWETALADLGKGLVDSLGGFVGSKGGSAIGTAIGGLVNPYGAVIGAIVGMMAGSSFGKEVAHSTHSGTTNTQAGSIGTDIGATSPSEVDSEGAVRALIYEIGENGLEATLGKIKDYMDNDLATEPRVYAKKRQYQNIIGSAHMAAYNFIV